MHACKFQRNGNKRAVLAVVTYAIFAKRSRALEVTRIVVVFMKRAVVAALRSPRIRVSSLLTNFTFFGALSVLIFSVRASWNKTRTAGGVNQFGIS
jgi:hypothetical protein